MSNVEEMRKNLDKSIEILSDHKKREALIKQFTLEHCEVVLDDILPLLKEVREAIIFLRDKAGLVEEVTALNKKREAFESSYFDILVKLKVRQRELNPQAKPAGATASGSGGQGQNFDMAKFLKVAMKA
jgi:hypothetical protein